MIPTLDLVAQYQALKPEIDAAVGRVLASGHYILGPEVEAFEKEAAQYLGVKHAIGLNSGTDALIIALRAMGVGPGHQVITTPFSFFATAEAIELVGAEPVFADVEESTFNIDPKSVKRLINPLTKAIIPVHLFGRPADLSTIESFGIPVLEDAAQAFGAVYQGQRLGTFGRMGAVSFFPSKNLGAAGDAGLLITQEDGLAATARALRAHGGRKKYYNEMLGYNSRLDAIQAAILRVKLPHLDKWVESRRRVALKYQQALQGVRGVKCPELVDGHVFHQYVIRVADGRRDELVASLRARGVDSAIYYPLPIDALPVYRNRFTPQPVSFMLSKEVLALPIWPEISDQQIETVATAVRESLR